MRLFLSCSPNGHRADQLQVSTKASGFTSAKFGKEDISSHFCRSHHCITASFMSTVLSAPPGLKKGNEATASQKSFLHSRAQRKEGNASINKTSLTAEVAQAILLNFKMAIKLMQGLEIKLQNGKVTTLHACLRYTSQRSRNQNNAGLGVTYLLIQYSLFFQVKKIIWVPIPNPIIREKA